MTAVALALLVARVRRPTAPPGSRSRTAASAPAGRGSRPQHLGPVDGPGRRGDPAHAGVDADARAYLLLRPYLKRAVRVEIADPADPAPYWLVSTAHADALVGMARSPATVQAGSALP